MITLKQNNIKLASNIEELIPLTEFAVEGRYAVIHDNLEDTSKYIVILNELLEYVGSIVACVVNS